MNDKSVKLVIVTEKM